MRTLVTVIKYAEIHIKTEANNIPKKTTCVRIHNNNYPILAQPDLLHLDEAQQ
jgi:hypothetical protein